MTGIDFTRLPVNNSNTSKKVEKKTKEKALEFNDLMIDSKKDHYRIIDINKNSESLKSVVSSVRKISNVNIKISNDMKLTKGDNASKKSQEVNKKETSNGIKIDKSMSKDISVKKNDNTCYSDEEIEEKVNDTVKKDLDVTDDKISLVLESLNLNLKDLLKPECLMDFTTEILGENDNTNLLFHPCVENLLNDIDDIMAVNENINIKEDNTSFQDDILTNKIDFNEVIINKDTHNKDFNQIKDSFVIEEDKNIINTSNDEDYVLDNRLFDDKEDSILNYNPLSNIDNKDEGDNTSNFLDSNNKNPLNEKKDDSDKTIDQSSKKTYVTIEKTLDDNQNIEGKTTLKNSDNYISFNKIADQIVKNAKVTIKENIRSMEMELNPKELGKIFMEVSERDGLMRAKLLAENENVKNILEKQLIVLKQDFKDQGLKVDTVEISVGTHEFRENQEDGASFNNFSNNEQKNTNEQENNNHIRRLNNINMNNLEEIMPLMTEEDILTTNMMKISGSTLNYRA